MNGIPMKLDYSKTINEQLPTFEYYKDRYSGYELQIMNLQQENTQLKSVLKEIREYIFNTYDDVISSFTEDEPMTNFKARKELLEIIDKAGIGEDNG